MKQLRIAAFPIKEGETVWLPPHERVVAVLKQFQAQATDPKQWYVTLLIEGESR